MKKKVWGPLCLIRTGPNLRIRLDRFFSAISVTTVFVCGVRKETWSHNSGSWEGAFLTCYDFVIVFNSIQSRLFPRNCIPKACRY